MIWLLWVLQKSQPRHKCFFQLLSWLPCLCSSLADSELHLCVKCPAWDIPLYFNFSSASRGFAVRDNSSIAHARERRFGCWQTSAREESDVWGEKAKRIPDFFEQGARLDQQPDRWTNCIFEESKQGNLSQEGFWVSACNCVCFSELNWIYCLDFHFHAPSLELQVPPVNTMQTQYNWLPQESLWKAAPWD